MLRTMLKQTAGRRRKAGTAARQLTAEERKRIADIYKPLITHAHPVSRAIIFYVYKNDPVDAKQLRAWFSEEIRAKTNACSPDLSRELKRLKELDILAMRTKKSDPFDAFGPIRINPFLKEAVASAYEEIEKSGAPPLSVQPARAPGHAEPDRIPRRPGPD